MENAIAEVSICVVNATVSVAFADALYPVILLVFSEFVEQLMISIRNNTAI
jgi:hypothetical protein